MIYKNNLKLDIIIATVSLSLNPEAWFVWHAAEVEEALAAREDFINGYLTASRLVAEKMSLQRATCDRARAMQAEIARDYALIDRLELGEQSQRLAATLILMQRTIQDLAASTQLSTEVERADANVKMYEEELGRLPENLFRITFSA